MEIKIKAESDDNKETYLLLTDEHLKNNDFINLVIVGGTKVKEDLTISLAQLFVALKAFVTIKEQSN